MGFSSGCIGNNGWISYNYLGWDIGVASMARGEMAVYTIKSEYAYGATGSPPKIPGGATLTFEIEVWYIIVIEKGSQSSIP